MLVKLTTEASLDFSCAYKIRGDHTFLLACQILNLYLIAGHQFHQHFTSSFCAVILSIKNYKAKM